GRLPRHFHHGGVLQPGDGHHLSLRRSTHRIRFTGRRMAMSGFIRRYASNYAAVAGLVILLLVIVIALVAPFVYASPWDMVAAPLIPPFTDAAHPFGTDMLGRDITAGLAWGAQMSLLVGLVSTAVALIVGIMVGSVAGYFGAG